MDGYSKEKILDDQHWQFEDYRQRIEASVWRQLLLNGDDRIIHAGRLRNLKAKKLGYGVVEIRKEGLPNG
jgi:hypothetical protein